MNQISLADAFCFLIKRDITLAIRNRSEMVNPLLFFVLIVTLFPLGLTISPQTLTAIAPAIIWVGALLATLLSLDTMFRSDFEDGSLEQLSLCGHPISILVVAKICAHWVVTGFPLIMVAPLLAMMLGIPNHAISTLMVTLILGTPVLSFVGAIGVALTVGLRRGGIILSLLVLPLYVPVLIFASSAVEMAAAGLPVNAQISMLTAILALALSLTPLPTAAALRLSLS